MRRMKITLLEYWCLFHNFYISKFSYSDFLVMIYNPYLSCQVIAVIYLVFIKPLTGNVSSVRWLLLHQWSSQRWSPNFLDTFNFEKLC